ncbi:MAG: BT_2262 family domain-containing protein [Candidatus Cryptobacteroides sp.]
MKTKIFSMMASTLAILALAGCTETSGLTGITYYPVISLEGGDTVVIGLGEDYVEPGFSVTLNGVDCTSDATVSVNVDNTRIGTYSVVYSAENELGFTATVSRTVVVVNEGHFDTVYSGDTKWGTRHYVGAPVLITDNGDGTYEIDDILAGYYFWGRYPGYEPYYDFHAEATFVLNADNTITKVGEVGYWYFGDDITDFDGTFDPATGVVSYTADFAGALLTVVLTPITK